MSENNPNQTQVLVPVPATEQVVKNTLKGLEAARKELTDLDSMIKDELVPQGMIKKLLRKIFGSSKKDGLAIIENRLRDLLNNNQEVMADIGKVAVEKRAEFSQLADELQEAAKEGWELPKLRAFLTEKIEAYSQPQSRDDRNSKALVIQPFVKQLLEKQVEFIKKEEATRRAEELYGIMISHLETGKELVNLLGKVLFSCIDVFEKTGLQYYSFMAFVKPLRVTKKAAEVLTDSQKSVIDAYEKSKLYLEKSIRGISLALDAVRLFRAYGLSTPAFKEFIEEKRIELEEKLTGLTGEHLLEEETEESDVNPSARGIPHLS